MALDDNLSPLLELHLLCMTQLDSNRCSQHRSLAVNLAHVVSLFAALSTAVRLLFNTHPRFRHSRKTTIITVVYPVVYESQRSSSVVS